MKRSTENYHDEFETGGFTELYKWCRQRDIKTKKFESREQLEHHVSKRYPDVEFSKGKNGSRGVFQVDNGADMDKHKPDYRFKRDVKECARLDVDKKSKTMRTWL